MEAFKAGVERSWERAESKEFQEDDAAESEEEEAAEFQEEEEEPNTLGDLEYLSPVKKCRSPETTFLFSFSTPESSSLSATPEPNVVKEYRSPEKTSVFCFSTPEQSSPIGPFSFTTRSREVASQKKFKALVSM